MVSYWGQVEGAESHRPQCNYNMQGGVRVPTGAAERPDSFCTQRWLRWNSSTHLISQAHGHREADQSQPRPTTHCVPALQFHFIEMQQFRVFSEQFFRASLARSRSVNADQRWHKILPQPKPTLLRAAPLCFLSPLWWVTSFPKPTLLYWPETEKWSFFSCLSKMAKQQQFDS